MPYFRLSGLSLSASLKAAQLSDNLILIQTSIEAISTRILIQSALSRYNNVGNNTAANWARSNDDLQSALSTNGVNALLVQAAVFPKNDTGPNGASGLVNITGSEFGTVPLPYKYPNGSNVYLGDHDMSGLGYPPSLYPNFTYVERRVNSTFNATHAIVNGQELGPDDTLVLGPLTVNQSLSLISFTVAINNNTSRQDILGWLTVVADTSILYRITESPEGLGDTGGVLIIGPATTNGTYGIDPETSSKSVDGNQRVKFVFPPPQQQSFSKRHPKREHDGGNPDLPFLMKDYPAVVNAYKSRNKAANNAGAMISSQNEENKLVSVGYATLSAPFVNWVLVLEQSHGEVYAPVNTLRKIVLACVFGTVGLILILITPVAHFSVRPIRALRTATFKTVEPYIPDSSSSGFSRAEDEQAAREEELEEAEARKEGFFDTLSRWRKGKGRHRSRPTRLDGSRRMFRIPGKVPTKKHWLRDELTDLTETFNEMSDELVMQYERLEERVKERTAELELSKQAAEVANESKTLFIANISHELKTPLNGILGMCAVCMQEDDLKKIRRSLGIIYKSGDLLLHLLTDLLTFSKNSIGQQLNLDEREFRVGDISTQVLSIFDKQAKDSSINLGVVFQGPNDQLGNADAEIEKKIYGPFGTGRVEDMCLWGDRNRILQVLINLVSNSLKFTPAGGMIEVRIRCIGLEPEDVQVNKVGSRHGSLPSRVSKQSRRRSKPKGRGSSEASVSQISTDMANSSPGDPDSTLNINVAGGTKSIPKVAIRKRSMSPAPLNTKHLIFEFEVEDTGPGIPESQQQRIFEPFVQGDLGLSKKFGGTGLGLSICTQLAGLMGGNMSLRSTIGIGSTFMMRIPLRFVKERAESITSSNLPLSSRPESLAGQPLFDEPRTPARGSTHSIHSAVSDRGGPHGNEPQAQPAFKLGPEEQQPRLVGFSQPFFTNPLPQESSQSKIQEIKAVEAEAARTGEKVKVLVAEDNKVNQEVVLRMLKLEDIYDVTVAKDGQEALDIVRASMDNNNERFDLVFMDIQMPNLDGIQSTRLIREIGFSAPIVALTAFAEESNVKECMDSGMNYFLSKPIKRPALKQVLKKYCPTIHEVEENDSGGASEGKESKRKHSHKPSRIKGVKKDPPMPASDDKPSVQPSEKIPEGLSIPMSPAEQGKVKDVMRKAREAQEAEGISPMTKQS
ncbi:MAG: hypothetical protein Q9227_000070 [Pyrenula ochraceoflavens]